MRRKNKGFSLIELIDAQNAHNSAKLALIDAQLDRGFARFRERFGGDDNTDADIDFEKVIEGDLRRAHGVRLRSCPLRCNCTLHAAGLNVARRASRPSRTPGHSSAMTLNQAVSRRRPSGRTM